MSNHEAIHWEIHTGVGHIILDRPDNANALCTTMAKHLAHAVEAAEQADIGAVLISARGKQFCAGGDINEFVANRERLSVLVRELLAIAHPTIHKLASLPVPVISALQGPLGGAGIAIGLCADLVLASTNVFLRGGYSALGLSSDLGASYFLSRRAGSERAKYILMTNRTIPAQQCLDWGLVDELHAPDELQPAAQALAEQLAAGATSALRHLKQLCNAEPQRSLQDQLNAEREAILDCARSSNSAEGISAFLEKRSPAFARR